jgi:hypothetical protein
VSHTPFARTPPQVSSSPQQYRSRPETHPTLSLVLPIHNEEEVIPELHRRLQSFVERVGAKVEVISSTMGHATVRSTSCASSLLPSRDIESCRSPETSDIK